MSISVPAWARAAVTRTHRVEYACSIVTGTGGEIPLPVTAGDLRQTADAYPRHSVDLSIGDMSLAPVSGFSPLTPFGNLLRVRYTLDDLAGNMLTFQPCPDLLIDSVAIVRGSDTRIDVTASDRSLAIDTDSFTVPTDPPAGFLTVSGLIGWLIRRTYPAAVIVDTLNSARYVGAQFQLDGSPWAAIESLADSVGGEVYQRADNAFVVRPVPAVGAINAGDDLRTGIDGTVTETSSRLIRGYNRVALAFRSDAADDRTIVGTWADRSGGALDVGGRYGRVTLAETRDLDTTQAGANSAAQAYARRSAGRVRDVEVTATPRPWVEVGDTLTVGFVQGSDDLVLTEVGHDLTGGPSVYRFRTDTLGPVA